MSLSPKEVYARKILPKEHVNLGDLVSIDSSLIDATLSMRWADYREGAKKAKVNIGFNINQSIPSKIFLTDTTFIIRTLMNGEKEGILICLQDT